LQLYANGKCFSHWDMNTATWPIYIFCSHRSFISAAQLSTDPEQPAAGHAHNTAPKPRTTETVLASPGFEAAWGRIDEIGKVIQPSVPSPHPDHFVQEPPG
jgi:hypothetical protein